MLPSTLFGLRVTNSLVVCSALLPSKPGGVRDTGGAAPDIPPQMGALTQHSAAKTVVPIAILSCLELMTGSESNTKRRVVLRPLNNEKGCRATGACVSAHPLDSGLGDLHLHEHETSKKLGIKIG